MNDIKTREGMEFWDKICSLKHYGFIHSPDNSRVLKAEGIGNWIDKYEAQEIVDQAQDRINELQAELLSVKENGRHWHESSNKAIDAMTLVANQRDALQLRMDAADQRIDELVSSDAGVREELESTKAALREEMKDAFEFQQRNAVLVELLRRSTAGEGQDFKQWWNERATLLLACLKPTESGASE